MSGSEKKMNERFLLHILGFFGHIMEVNFIL